MNIFKPIFPPLLSQGWRLLQSLVLICIASFLLSSCAQYEVGVNFYNETSGEIVQHLKLSDRLTTFTPIVADQWFDQLQARAQQLQGRGQRLAPNEFEIRIPFSSGDDLAEKFNQLFQAESSLSDRPIPEIIAQVQIAQDNKWLALRNQLQLDLDLRSLGVLLAQGEALVNSGDLFDLRFYLNTPWGAEVSQTAEQGMEIETIGNQVIWSLQPGEVNHLEAVFWVPSPVGIGSVAIVLFVLAGTWFRQQFSIILDPDPNG